MTTQLRVRALSRPGRRLGIVAAAASLAGVLSLSAAPASAAVPTVAANPALVPVQATRPSGEANAGHSIDTLRQRLRLTPAQEPAFRAVADAIRAHERDMGRLPRPPRNARLSVVEGMQLELRYMEVQVKGLRRMVPALKALYARLSVSQRRELDAYFRPPRRR